MARKSVIERNLRRRRLVEKFSASRAKLKSRLNLLRKSDISHAEALKSFALLVSAPRDSSATRVRNRCLLSGRSRGFIRYFGLGRVKFRELASFVELPGIRKANF